MNHFFIHYILFFTLLSLISCDTAHQDTPKPLQACVLYGTDDNTTSPIPLQKCVEIRPDTACNHKVINSENSSKVWRSYPLSLCSNPDIASGLTERYLLEGID